MREMMRDVGVGPCAPRRARDEFGRVCLRSCGLRVRDCAHLDLSISLSVALIDSTYFSVRYAVALFVYQFHSPHDQHPAALPYLQSCIYLWYGSGTTRTVRRGGAR